MSFTTTCVVIVFLNDKVHYSSSFILYGRRQDIRVNIQMNGMGSVLQPDDDNVCGCPTLLSADGAIAVLTMNPLYQALICCLVKFVFSMRKSMSSRGKRLLPTAPISRGDDVLLDMWSRVPIEILAQLPSHA